MLNVDYMRDRDHMYWRRGGMGSEAPKLFCFRAKIISNMKKIFGSKHRILYIFERKEQNKSFCLFKSFLGINILILAKRCSLARFFCLTHDRDPLVLKVLLNLTHCIYDILTVFLRWSPITKRCSKKTVLR